MAYLYTNEELTKWYVSYMLARSRGIVSHSGYILRAIKGSELVISAFYSRYGNLDSLKIKRIGQDTKETLERIIEYGVDEALEMAREERSKETEEDIKRSWNMMGYPSTHHGRPIHKRNRDKGGRR